eukprot:3161070-Pyramimonas_sp.AAC.1
MLVVLAVKMLTLAAMKYEIAIVVAIGIMTSAASGAPSADGATNSHGACSDGVDNLGTALSDGGAAADANGL